MKGLAALLAPETYGLLASLKMPEQTPGPRACLQPRRWDSVSPGGPGIPWKRDTSLVCSCSTSFIGHWILVHRAGVVAPETVSWCGHCPDRQSLAGPWVRSTGGPPWDLPFLGRVSWPRGSSWPELPDLGRGGNPGAQEQTSCSLPPLLTPQPSLPTPKSGPKNVS